MITREELVVGATFSRNEYETATVEILGIGETNVFLHHSSGLENVWSIQTALQSFCKTPPPKKRGAYWTIIYDRVWDKKINSASFKTKESAQQWAAGLQIKVLAIVEVPWEEGQGLDE